ncbi:MAG: ABC transporter permease [Rhodopirellula sp.]|nr:ABC transporter permease [Rhodopirellula sp.]
MSGTFVLARRHVWHHRGRSLVLIACLTVTCSLPLGLRYFTRHFETQLTARARTTPLVIGAAGSRFDLALHALYFRGQPPRETTMRELDRITDSGFAEAMPLLVRFKAEGSPIVGTTTAYLKFRQLRIASGKPWTRYGDCLLGANVARRLQLGAGDRLTSEPENVFDVDGSFPLKMRITGVLAETNSPDDDAVFVEIYTAWIIAGIGHGHAPSRRVTGTGRRSDAKTTAGEIAPAHDASLIEYTEITDENARSFHFHGTQDQFPLTAIIAAPHDEESETLLLGRYLADDDPSQVLRPVEVISELMEFVLQIRRFFELTLAAMMIVTAALLILFVILTVQLRQREFATMFRLGGSRFLIVRLVGTELLILFSVSGLLTLLMLVGFATLVSRLSFVG